MADAGKPPASRTLGQEAPASRRWQARSATAMLVADHKRVSGLFADYRKARSASRKASLVAQICMELTIHAQIEEEIFYPAFREALNDRELVPQATVEHAAVKDLIAQLKGTAPDGEMYDARVKVMSEFVRHHVREEQTEIFLRARRSRLDLVALGERMAARRQELMAARA